MARSFEDRELFDPLAATDLGWEPVSGYPEGVSRTVLYEEDDRRSALVRYDPGTDTGDEPLTHGFYEECWILQGEIVDKRLGETFGAGSYTTRTPGMVHGPYRVPADGDPCLMFVHEFEE